MKTKIILGESVKSKVCYSVYNSVWSFMNSSMWVSLDVSSCYSIYRSVNNSINNRL